MEGGLEDGGPEHGTDQPWDDLSLHGGMRYAQTLHVLLSVCHREILHYSSAVTSVSCSELLLVVPDTNGQCTIKQCVYRRM